MNQIWKKLCSVFLTLCLVLTLMPVTAFAADANSLKSTIESYAGGTGKLYAEVDGDTVTVTGTVTDATSPLELMMYSGVTVIWEASITSSVALNEKLIDLQGGGTFEVADGGKVCATGDGDKAIDAFCDVAVSGGTVSSTTSSAIWTSGNATVSGGTVSTTSGLAINAFGANSTVTVSGGTVLATEGDGNAIKAHNNVNVTDTGEVIVETTSYAISADGDVMVSGGIVRATSGTAIFTRGNATVSGGTVSATSASAIYAAGKSSTVTISGGTVSNSATSLANPVIRMYEDENTSENVTVSGDGKVLAEADGYAIMTYGNVKVTENAQVSATTASAICATGAGSTVTVSGGAVSNSATSLLNPVIYMKNESNTSENVTVSGDGKVLAQADGGRAIMTYGNVKVKENAQVSTTTGQGIYAAGAGFTVTVTDSAQVSATTGRAINIANVAGSTVTVSGDGKVLAQADGGHAIMTYGNVTVTDSAQVSATTGRAIWANGAGSTVTVSGGGVFAYGTAITGENQVIYLGNNESAFTKPTSDGVVIAWNKNAGTTQYDSGSNIDLSVSPSGTAAWSKKDGQSGIFYNNKNTNTGFFAVDGVMVIKSSSPVTLSQLSYTDPTTLNLTYDGSQQGIGSVTAADSVNLGAISVYYTGTGDTSYSKSTKPPTDTGTYQVTADVAESPDYEATSGLVLGTYTITKAAAPTITWPAAGGISYGDALSDSMLSGGSTEFGSFAWTNGTVVPNVNNSGFEVTFTPSEATLQNYEIITDTTSIVSVAVGKIGVLGEEKTYQIVKGYARAYSFDLTALVPAAVDASEVSAYTYVSHTNINSLFSDTPSVSGTTLTLPVASVAAGLTDTVTISFTSENYMISNAKINVETVDKTPVTITANMTGGVYNGQPYGYSNLSVISNNDSSVITDSITLEVSYKGINSTSYSQSTEAPKDAGKYMLTLSVPDNDTTYTGSKVFTFTIEKRPVTVKAENKSMTKGDTLPAFTCTANGQLSDETALNGTPTLTCAADGSTAGTYDINVDMSGVTYTANYKAAEPAFVSGTLTVSNPSNGHPSSGGPSTTAPSTNVSGSTATTTATAETNSDGKAAASVTQSQVNSAIEKAQKASQNTGEAPSVEIQVDGASGADTVETTLPESAIHSLLTDEIESLTISSPVAAMTFDAQAIAAISDAASGEVIFTASQVETSDLSDAAQQVVGDRPVYDFSVISDGNDISQFDGTVTLSIPYTPASGEDVNAIVAYYINANGEPELMENCRYDAETGSLVFITTHFSQYAVGYNKIAFSDVSDTAWYTDAISYLAARGITGGTSETTFSPDATLTRGQFITLVMRAYDIEPDDNSSENFSDAGNTYYTGYLVTAKQLGISNGIGDNKFAPEQAISRQEMFTLLYNALKAIDKLPEGDSNKTLYDFTDSSSVSSYAQDAITCLVKTGTVSGNNGLLLPAATTTRAQMAQVLYKLLAK